MTKAYPTFGTFANYPVQPIISPVLAVETFDTPDPFYGAHGYRSTSGWRGQGYGGYSGTYGSTYGSSFGSAYPQGGGWKQGVGYGQVGGGWKQG